MLFYNNFQLLGRTLSLDLGVQIYTGFLLLQHYFKKIP